MINIILDWFRGVHLCGMCGYKFKSKKPDEIWIKKNSIRENEEELDHIKICVDCALILEATKMRDENEVPYDVIKY